MYLVVAVSRAALSEVWNLMPMQLANFTPVGVTSPHFQVGI